MWLSPFIDGMECYTTHVFLFGTRVGLLLFLSFVLYVWLSCLFDDMGFAFNSLCKHVIWRSPIHGAQPLGLSFSHHLSPRPSQSTPRPETLATPLQNLFRKFCIFSWLGGAAGKVLDKRLNINRGRRLPYTVYIYTVTVYNV